MSMIQVQVRRKSLEAQDIASFELVRPDGAPLPEFSAGSHIDVRLPDGMLRQYSLCNDDGDSRHYRIAVLRDAQSRGGSRAMHDAVGQGDLIEISPPRNHFPLVEAQRTLLFAGGIGVTPLLCMAQRLAKSGADFQLHYCVRTPDRTAFRDEIASSGFASRVGFHYDDGPADQRLDLASVLAGPGPDVHAYVCGPQGFIDHVTAAARLHGWGDEQLHVEYFQAAPLDSTGDGAFRVKVASSGNVYGVPAGRTVVQVLGEHGIDIPVSCEQGICGTCITGVLDGQCDHRDLYFTDEEKERNDRFTPCCSRAKSPLLVLDL
ncbi:MAG TPA: PDR/VanB family oxidoreductase [Burkholderiaceae bacterium]|nr:PDR/VanB family oxidoreductase [Burkholderiaceae bacterium]